MTECKVLPAEFWNCFWISANWEDDIGRFLDLKKAWGSGLELHQNDRMQDPMAHSVWFPPLRSAARYIQSETAIKMKISAREFAIAAHGDQRYGERPYLFHLEQVVENLSEFGSVAETVGYLHDVVEDTSITVAEISEKFGPLVAECVALLTDGPGTNRKERKAKTYKKLAAVSGPSELALIVKVADRLANVRACIADGKVTLLNVYRDEHPTFRAAAYRPGQCEALWGQLDGLLQEGACGTGV